MSVIVVWVGLDKTEDMICPDSVGNKNLGTIDDVFIPLYNSRCMRCGQIGARIGFGQGSCHNGVTGHQRRKISLFLLFCAKLLYDLRPKGRGPNGYGNPRINNIKFLHYETGIETAHPRSAILFFDKNPYKAQLCRLLKDGLVKGLVSIKFLRPFLKLPLRKLLSGHYYVLLFVAQFKIHL